MEKKIRLNKIVNKKENRYFNKDFIDIGDNEKEYFYFIKNLDNFKERDIIYNLIDYIELKYSILILKFSLEYKKNGSYFLVEKYKEIF